MKSAIGIGAGVLLLAAGIALFFAFNGPQDAPAISPDAADGHADPALGDEGDSAAAPESAADQKMQELEDASARIEHLDWIAGQEWARSDLPMLRKTIVSDPSEEVQLHAVEKALELAGEEGDGATSRVVRLALASTRGNTRARGLKAARENPDVALVPELIELVDNRDPYATMALNALAYTDDPDAHAKVLEVASDEEATPKLRQRAIALLAVTKDPEAFELLNRLANGEDETLRRLADEVLRVLNEG